MNSLVTATVLSDISETADATIVQNNLLISTTSTNSTLLVVYTHTSVNSLSSGAGFALGKIFSHYNKQRYQNITPENSMPSYKFQCRAG